MMYPYLIMADETEITHSHIIDNNGVKEVEVHFERPTEQGFDAARCSLPDYNWIIREGFSGGEIKGFEQFLRDNAHLFYKYAENGGIKVA